MPPIVVASIFVLTGALELTGVSQAIGAWIGRLAGSTYSRAIAVIMPAVALLSAQWIHADLHLPAWLERLLAWVFVSPAMHRVHHHKSLPWTDSNYSTIFSLWDRLFGTYAALDTRHVEFGVDVVPESAAREQSALRLMRLALLPAREGYRKRIATG